MTPLVTPESPPRLAQDQKALDKAIVGGMAWTAGAKWSGQVVQWGTTLIVARLLTPADYGLVGMAAVILGLITLFSEFGLGTAVVAFHDLNAHQRAELHTVAVLLGVLGFLISCGLAVPMGLFFRTPKLPLVIVVTATGFLVVAYRTVPYAMLQKEMRFRLLAVLDAVQVVAQAIGTLVLAVLGFGYWALVIGGLVGKTVSAFLPFVYEPIRFARPRWKSIERELRYSSHVIGGRLCYYGYDNADTVIIGRILGQVPLGAYSLGYTLAHAPAEKLAMVTNRVALSLFAAVRTDSAALRRYLRNLTQGISLLIFPAGVGGVLVAPEFVHFVLGKKWEGAIVPLQLLSLYVSFRAIRTLLSPLLNALGEPHLVMKNNLMMLLVLPVCFYIGSHWGTAGVAASWVLIYPVLTLPLFRDALHKADMKKREYFQALWPAISGLIPMVTVVVFLKWWLPHSLPLYIRFGTLAGAGAAAYTVTLFALHRDRLLAIYQLRRLLTKAS